MIKVTTSKTFEKQFLKLDKEARRSVFSKIESFAEGDGNVDLKKIQPKELGKYRIRVGKYRAVFKYLDSTTIELLIVDSRGSVYDRF